MNYVTRQFEQYSIPNIETSVLEKYAKEMLQKAEEKRKISDNIYEYRIVLYVKKALKINTKEISVEDFNKLFGQKSKKK